MCLIPTTTCRNFSVAYFSLYDDETFVHNWQSTLFWNGSCRFWKKEFDRRVKKENLVLSELGSLVGITTHYGIYWTILLYGLQIKPMIDLVDYHSQPHPGRGNWLQLTATKPHPNVDHGS